MKIKSHNFDQFAPFSLIKDLVFKSSTSSIAKQFYNYVIPAEFTASSSATNLSDVFDTVEFPVFITQISAKVFVDDVLIVPENTATPIDDITIQISAKGSSDNNFSNPAISVYALNDLCVNNDKFIGFVFDPVDNLSYQISHPNPTNWLTENIRVEIAFSGIQIPQNTYNLLQYIYSNEIMSKITVAKGQSFGDTVFIPSSLNIGTSFFNYTINNTIDVSTQTTNFVDQNTIGFPFFVTQMTTQLYVDNTYQSYLSNQLDKVTLQITDIGGSNSIFANEPLSIYALKDLALNNDNFNGLLLIPNKSFRYLVNHSPSVWNTSEILNIKTIYSGLQVTAVDVNRYMQVLEEYRAMFENRNY
jgi:hypothetical protein